MASPSGSYLTVLLPEQKQVLCRKRLLDATSYDDLVTFIETEWNHGVSRNTVANFLTSHEGRDMLKLEHEKVRENFLNEPLVEKGTRVIKLRDKAIEIDRYLQTTSIESDAWLSYSQELRQYLKMLREEIDGSKITLESGRESPADWWEQAREKAQNVEPERDDPPVVRFDQDHVALPSVQ